MKKAIILLSGGLDSAVTLSLAVNKKYEPFCLSFSYGQKHIHELKCAKEIKKEISPTSEHRIIEIDPIIFGNSSLTTDMKVPKFIGRTTKIPNTYVPARNTIFLSYALAFSEIMLIPDIFIGANILDYSGYPDCRPEYINIFNKLANLGLAYVTKKNTVKIQTPLMSMNKKEIIQLGLKLKTNFQLTSSCYNPINGIACSKCDACHFRLHGFHECGIKDPIKYV